MSLPYANIKLLIVDTYEIKELLREPFYLNLPVRGTKTTWTEFLEEIKHIKLPFKTVEVRLFEFLLTARPTCFLSQVETEFELDMRQR